MVSEHVKNSTDSKSVKFQKKLQVQTFINIFIVDYSMHIGVI